MEKSESNDGTDTSFVLESNQCKSEGISKSHEKTSVQTKEPLSNFITKSYTVKERDTLTSVAATFDTTPTELAKLNRLNSSFIFPGQVLSIRLNKSMDNNSEQSVKMSTQGPTSTNLEQNEMQINNESLGDLKPIVHKTGFLESQNSGDENLKAGSTKIPERFLKINVRHITDGRGVVSGVLLITPNAVMFDPNVSDPLVIENGPETYGVIATLQFVVNVAIYNDIIYMRVNGGQPNESGPTEIYYPNKELKDDKNISQNTNIGISLQEKRKSFFDQHWTASCSDRPSQGEWNNISYKKIDCDARTPEFPVEISATKQIEFVENEDNKSSISKEIFGSNTNYIMPATKISENAASSYNIDINSEQIPPTTIQSVNTIGNSSCSNITTDIKIGKDSFSYKKNLSVSSSVSDENEHEKKANIQNRQIQVDKSVNKKNRMIKRLSYPLTWVDNSVSALNPLAKSTDVESAPNTGDSGQSVFSKVFSSSPITLVSGLGGNLFSKTSSEDSGMSTAPPFTPQSLDFEGYDFFGQSSIGTSKQPQSFEDNQTFPKPKTDKTQHPKLNYQSMVSLNDKPNLFISVDKLVSRPEKECADPPLYLRLRMGKPIGNTVPIPTSIMSYGKNSLHSEYWFIVPKNRVEDLYWFLNTWMKQLYGELDKHKLIEQGLELIQSNDEWTGSHVRSGAKGIIEEYEETTDLTRESWELIKAPYVKIFNIIKTAGSNDLDLFGSEVLSANTDGYTKSSFFAEDPLDFEVSFPELNGQTEILTEEHRKNLFKHLLARAEGYPWSLVFSTSQHGFSLSSLYRKMEKIESPILIVIKDTRNNVFGALTSCALHISDHFYGTGESMLYKFDPDFKVFHWTGENVYFIKGNVQSLSIGAGDGQFGLWLDGDLNQGRSQFCSTYGNEPLAPEEDFTVKTLECWAFI